MEEPRQILAGFFVTLFPTIHYLCGKLEHFAMHLNLIDILATFMVMFAIIDIPGSIPIILDIKAKTGDIEPLKATLVAFGIFIVFLFTGDKLLGLFGVDVSSFAIAGSFVILLIGMEMVLGIELFKHESSGSGSVVPIAFPLIAGAGSITTLLSLKADYHSSNILVGLILNMIVVFLVLRLTNFFGRILGPAGLHILKKMFGIILLAIAIRLFLNNTGIVLPNGK